MAAKPGPLVVAAIDFGTAYSGWAFSFKHDFEREPTKVSSKIWIGGQLTSLKAPTSVLIKPDGKTLEAFGYDAETRYSELSENDEHKKWYYFRRFKMSLWRKPIHKDTMIEDECGRELSALSLFSLSIRFMKEDMLKTFGNQAIGLGSDDILWVLTVPAIWNDSAKQFMRLAAEQAGISTNNLKLALEPEAASLYCRHLPVQKDGESSLSTFQAGKKYLVLDTGGGTIDITVHEVCADGNIKEIHEASGGDWGGTMVDEAFMDFICKITDTGAIQRFKDTNMEDYIELLRDFEIKKRQLDTVKTGKVTIKIPGPLTQLVQDVTGMSFKEKLQTSGYGNQVELAGDKLRLDADVMRYFFSSSMSKIIEHVSDLLRKPECAGVEAIVMVGGYSESPLFQETIKKRFVPLTILVPPDAGLAVLKGALIYGHCPTSISERISKYTYGILAVEDFNEVKHPWSQRIVYDNGAVMCNNVFSIIVSAGDKLVLGEAQREEKFSPVYDNQKSMTLPVFVSNEKDPKYTTDVGCKKVGNLEIPLAGRGIKRSVLVRMIFGGTEIIVESVEEATGRIRRLKIDFLI